MRLIPHIAAVLCYIYDIALFVLLYSINISNMNSHYSTLSHSHPFTTTNHQTEHGDISRQIDKFKAANKYIKEDTIWSYLIQICNGLQIMHGRQVLHRDIKPKNVFLTGKNHVRLGDLGCAKLMKAGMARTQIGEVLIIFYGMVGEGEGHNDDGNDTIR
jgi:serine/threonine protein kinase